MAVFPSYPGIFEIFLYLFMFFFLFFGLGVGFIIALTIIGLIGGLLSLLCFNRKIIRFPNEKVAIFVGYIAFLVIFFILPILLALLPAIFSPSSYGSSFTPLSLLTMLFSLPFIHCVITIGFYIFLRNKNTFNNNYFGFITAYFLASLTLAPFTIFFGFLGLLGGYGSLIPGIF